jgi:hypothetical protein
MGATVAERELILWAYRLFTSLGDSIVHSSPSSALALAPATNMLDSQNISSYPPLSKLLLISQIHRFSEGFNGAHNKLGDASIIVVPIVVAAPVYQFITKRSSAPDDRRTDFPAILVILLHYSSFSTQEGFDP